MVSHKKVDSLGRVVIPKTIRLEADINEGDMVDVIYDGKYIKVVKRGANYINGYIKSIKNIAAESHNITSSEYDELMRLLKKLK